jgi:hypothetical protein
MARASEPSDKRFTVGYIHVHENHVGLKILRHPQSCFLLWRHPHNREIVPLIQRVRQKFPHNAPIVDDEHSDHAVRTLVSMGSTGRLGVSE